MTESVRKLRFPTAQDASWRLKLFAWSQIVIGALGFFGLIDLVIVLPAFGSSSFGKSSWSIFFGAIASFTLIVVRVYSGLLLLGRSRPAWVLALLVVSTQFVITLEDGPLFGFSTLLEALQLGLVASVWKEVEGPYPFRLQNYRQVLLGVAVVCLFVPFIPGHRIIFS